jgi:hypothetical protein
MDTGKCSDRCIETVKGAKISADGQCQTSIVNTCISVTNLLVFRLLTWRTHNHVITCDRPASSAASGFHLNDPRIEL